MELIATSTNCSHNMFFSLSVTQHMDLCLTCWVRKQTSWK